METLKSISKTAGRSRIVNLLAELVIGAAIGYLIGLSISPLVGSVVTGVIAAAITLTTTYANLGNTNAKAQQADVASSHRPLDLVPLALLVLGLAGGASFGIFCRTHGVLGILNTSQLKNVDSEKPSAASGYLFAAPGSDECTTWRAASLQNHLQAAMKRAREDRISRFASEVGDEKVLNTALEELICPAPSNGSQ